MAKPNFPAICSTPGVLAVTCIDGYMKVYMLPRYSGYVGIMLHAPGDLGKQCPNGETIKASGVVITRDESVSYSEYNICRMAGQRYKPPRTPRMPPPRLPFKRIISLFRRGG